MCGLFQTDVTNEIVGRLTCQFLHLTMQMNTTDANLVSNTVDAEVGVADVFVDDLHDTVKQLFVR